MLAVLDSNWWQVGGYLVVVAFTVRAGRRDRRQLQPGDTDDLWPTFWVVTAVLFAAMAIGHAGGLGDSIADLGRRGARSDGWYDTRRTIQSVAVGFVGAGWAVVTLFAIWRFPQRRRRYLPMTIVAFSLVCFAAIRVVSLHQIDSLLYRREILGAQVGGLAELIGLTIASAVTFWQPASSDHRVRSDSNRAASVDPR